MDDQPTLPTFDWPAIVAGPSFVTFELRGKPGHKGRHRQAMRIPKEAWTVLPSGSKVITFLDSKKIYIHQYPDPETEAYEKVLAEAAGLFMRGRSPTENPVALLVHAFKIIPESWSKTDKAKAMAGYIRPTSRPDWDNYGKITDALNGVVWKDDSQVVDGRVLKFYSDRPALRVEVRELVPPPAA